jgi:hypothetical protein
MAGTKKGEQNLPRKRENTKTRKSLCFSLRFIAAYALRTVVPPGLPILPDFLCWWAFEVHSYDCTPTASTGYLY